MKMRKLFQKVSASKLHFKLIEISRLAESLVVPLLKISITSQSAKSRMPLSLIILGTHDVPRLMTHSQKKSFGARFFPTTKICIQLIAARKEPSQSQKA